MLDGLEPLEYPPGPLAGELKDAAVSTLLKGLAGSNPWLCVVMTRESVKDLESHREATAPEWPLGRLSALAGLALLESLGVHGAESELEELVKDVGGHALTLNLLGQYLSRAHGGDVRRRDRVQLEKADLKTQGGHAFKAMAAYESWLAEGGEEGAQQLAVLRLLGLFDRPVDAGCHRGEGDPGRSGGFWSSPFKKGGIEGGISPDDARGDEASVLAGSRKSPSSSPFFKGGKKSPDADVRSHRSVPSPSRAAS